MTFSCPLLCQIRLKAGIPATYFCTGEDPVIHTAADTSDRLNYEGMAKILGYLCNYITTISNNCR